MSHLYTCLSVTVVIIFARHSATVTVPVISSLSPLLSLPVSPRSISDVHLSVGGVDVAGSLVNWARVWGGREWFVDWGRVGGRTGGEGRHGAGLDTVTGDGGGGVVIVVLGWLTVIAGRCCFVFSG